MKISVSLYSSKYINKRQLIEKAKALSIAGADYLHLDYRFDTKYPFSLKEIGELRKESEIPLDVHLISKKITKEQIQILNDNKVSLCSVQYEDLKNKDDIFVGSDFFGHWGIAIQTQTDLKALNPYKNVISFISLMATCPGKSNGVFDPKNFEKISKCFNLYPWLKVHVDGGIDYNIGRALRLAKVDVIVSGSFVMNNDFPNSITKLHLGRDPAKIFVRHIMIPKNSLPLINMNASFKEVISSISKGKLGITFVVKEDSRLAGVIVDGDIRRAFQEFDKDIVQVKAGDFMNREPFIANSSELLNALFNRIENSSKGIIVVPVCDKSNKLLGAVDIHHAFGGY